MKKLVSITVLVAICLLFCLVMLLSGTVAIDHAGFAVDNAGLLYIGGGHRICVYNESKLVKSIEKGTARGFAFTIKDGDTIIVSNTTHIWEMDLDGNVINEYLDEGSRTFNDLQRNKVFVTEDGITYYYRSFFGRKQIYCGDELVYQMPIFDYCVKILLYISAVSFFGCVFSIVYTTNPIFDKYRKRKKK